MNAHNVKVTKMASKLPKLTTLSFLILFTSREIDDSVRCPDHPSTSNISTCSRGSDHRHFDSTKASYRAYESEERSGEKNDERDSDYFED